MKVLKKFGCYKVREWSKASHEIWFSPITKNEFTMLKPHGGGKTYRIGTIQTIVSQAWIDKKEFIDYV